MVKNEEVLLDTILPIWKTYEVDKFVFFDDNSQDKSLEIIRSHIPEKKIKILNFENKNFNESRNRQLMLDYSKEDGAEYIAAIDCDELLSSNLAENLKNFLPHFNKNNIFLYWFNVINNNLSDIRNDGYYKNAYHLFLAHKNNLNNLNYKNFNYHSSWRMLPASSNFFITKEIGIIHLQAMNLKYYALKQLWYKHYEYKYYKYTPELINQRYDQNINYLNFELLKCSANIYKNLKINSEIFDKVLESKKYKKFILDNYEEKLITFGKEYLK
jgi:hypothetical protein